jgi:RsiW-degrading membrane proteinase PrsW (M82 family)
MFLGTLSPAEAVARGFAGPAVHIVFASLWGYRIGRTRLSGGNVIRAALVWLAVAALLHGAYDFIVLGYSGTGLAFAALLILTLWVWRLRVVWRLNARADRAGT